MREKLGQTNASCLAIDTGQSPPVQSYCYRIAPAWKEELHGEIKQLLDQGILKPSHSPWSVPMVPIRESNGSLWLCINYRKLNQVRVGDLYLGLMTCRGHMVVEGRLKERFLSSACTEGEPA